MLDVQTILALQGAPGVGRRTVLRAVALAAGRPAAEPSPALLLDLLEGVRRSHPRTRVPSYDALDTALSEAHEKHRLLDELGCAAIALGAPDYPTCLRGIDDPPPVLFVRGGAVLDSTGVAIVGTRSPSAYGAACSRRLAAAAVERGFSVVSGLAAGCDAEAHAGAVEAGGVTVAVLAHGLDRVYPRDNAALAERILEGGGALVSEYAPGTPPSRASFVERDRIQSGLARGVVVVETGPVGGTMHTAGAALQQGRRLAVVEPRGADRKFEQGAGRLLRDGALRLCTAQDFDAFLNDLSRGGLPEPDSFPGQIQLFV